MKRRGTKDMKVGRTDFILSEPEATVDGVLDNSPSDWLSLREFHEIVSNSSEYVGVYVVITSDH